MGDLLKEQDIHVESFANQLNMRFAPPAGLKTHHGGIEELAELQKEFGIFKKGRRLSKSMAVLNIGSTAGNSAKNVLYGYFDGLARMGSNVGKLNGEEAIVDALLKNFAAKQPLPVYFKYHDMAAPHGDMRVLVTPRAKPVSYFNHEFLVLSFPTAAQGAVLNKPEKAAKPAKPAKTEKAAKPAKAAKAAKAVKAAKPKKK
jgi:hypothetical protein